MSVNRGSPLAREWAREEIKKLQLLDLYELMEEERTRDLNVEDKKTGKS